MIKRFCTVTVLILLLLVPTTVHADVVFGNEFFYQNESKTETLGNGYIGKRFVVNSPEGFVIPKVEPGSEEGIPSDSGYKSGWGYTDIEVPEHDVFLFENGKVIYVMATYLHNGQYWGIMPPSHMYQPPGWVRMDELLVMYDYQDFELENKSNFYTYTGSYDAILSAKKIVGWQWPGSDQEKRIIDIEDSVHRIESFTKILYAYKDAEGREWGKTSYLEIWICLSDPENRNIPAFYPAPQPTTWSPDGNHNWRSTNIVIYPAQDVTHDSQPGDNLKSVFSRPAFIIALATVFIAGTTVMVGILWKSKRSGPKVSKGD